MEEARADTFNKLCASLMLRRLVIAMMLNIVPIRRDNCCGICTEVHAPLSMSVLLLYIAVVMLHVWLDAETSRSRDLLFNHFPSWLKVGLV